MRWFIFTIFFLIVLTNSVSGQISQGGRPLDLAVLKSRGIPVIAMPMVNNKLLQQKALMAGEQDLKLKPASNSVSI